MEKWNLPPEKPPFWLDPGVELITNPPAIAPGAFVILCIESMPDLPGLDILKRIDVVANCVVETGWGKYRKGNNLGGWKITKGAAGPGVPWFRARGNKAPGASETDYRGGDPPWCWYRVFASFEDFFAQWLARFVPRNAPKGHRYKKCGEEFWAGKPWFDDLIAAGYKGENTKANPDRSIAGHEQLSEKCAMVYAQHLLRVDVDGDFGPKSEAAAKKLLGVPEAEWSGELFGRIVHAVKPGMDLGALSTPLRAPQEPSSPSHGSPPSSDASRGEDGTA